MTLYEINSAIEEALTNILNSTDDETGEVDESFVNELEELQIKREEKLDNIGAYIKNLLAEAKMLKEEEAALKARREAKEKKAESLKNYLAAALDGEKFESARVVCSWRKSETVVVPDVELIPEDFTISKTEIKPDKAKIKEAIKSGTEVRGAYLETKNNLQIK